MMITDTSTYLGPAAVLDSAGRAGWVAVELPTGERAWARLAFTMAYEPAPGDEILVIARDQDHMFAIGVLRAAGAVSLRVTGDLRIAAGGGITLASPRGITLRSEERLEASAPALTLRAGRLEILAQRLVERLGSAFVWIKEVFQLKARRMRALAEKDYVVRAGRMHLRSREDFSIDGRTIHLG